METINIVFVDIINANMLQAFELSVPFLLLINDESLKSE